MDRFAPVAAHLLAELGEKFVPPLATFVICHLFGEIQVRLDLGDEPSGGGHGRAVVGAGAIGQRHNFQILQVVGVVDLVLGGLGLLLAGKSLGSVEIWRRKSEG